MVSTLDLVDSERLEELHRVLVHGPTPVTVVIADADPTWPTQYDAYATALQSLLGERLLMVEHIGSTSVPGLAAKPVIDIVAGIEDPDDEPAYLPDLVTAGWELRVREPGHRCLRAEPAVQRFHGGQRCPPTCTATGQAVPRSAGTCTYEPGCEPTRPPAPDMPT